MSQEVKVWSSLVNPHVSRVRPYIPGKPIAAVKRELGLEHVIKLASNENPLGPSPRAVRALKEHTDELHRYPESIGPELLDQLAKRLKVDRGQIILGNGSNEILVLLAQAFLAEGDELVYADPSFVVYEMMAQMMGARAVKIPLKAYTHDLPAMQAACTSRTKMVCVCNPNNPTGTMVTEKELKAFMDGLPPSVIVVMDEAYFEYVERADYPNGIDFVGRGRPVVTLRSFSKIYGLAGLRIGYGIGDPEMVGILHGLRQPFNVNQLAIYAATAALSDAKHVAASLKVNAEGKAALTQALDGWHIKYAPTVANFIYVDFEKPAADLVRQLLERGIIVRQMNDQCVRMTIGTPEENQRLIQYLGEILAMRPVS